MRTAVLTQLGFVEAATAWLETRKPYLAERTIRDYAEYIETLGAFFAEIRLPEVGPDHIRAYQRMRMARAGAGRINQECGCLQQMLRRIGRWRDIGMDYQPLPLKKELRGRALNPHERERLLRYAMSKPEWEMPYLYIVMSLNTTMRPKEVMTLKREDINLVARTIKVKRCNAKNEGSARGNPLNDLAFAACARALESASSKGAVNPNDYVFPFRISGNRHGGYYDVTRPMTTFKTAWGKIIKAANLPGLRPYDMRHTGITDLLEIAEVSEETAEAIAGHIDPRVKKVYSHIRQEAKRKALDALMRKSIESVKNLDRNYRKKLINLG